MANSTPTTISHHGASGGKASAISQAVTMALPSRRNKSERLAARLEHRRLGEQRSDAGDDELDQHRRAEQPDVDGDAGNSAASTCSMTRWTLMS